MKLLFVDFSLPFLIRDAEYPVGGWAVELDNWLKGLVSEGHRCGVLTWQGATAFVGADVPFDLIETYDPTKGVRVLKYFYDYIPSMLKAARAYRPDVLIQSCAGVNTGIMAYIAARLGVPFVYRVASNADTDGWLYARTPILHEQLAYAFGLRRASVVVCQNRYQLEQLQSRLPHTSLCVIQNPFLPVAQENRSLGKAERDYIAWLGVFKDAKNLPLLITLARKLPAIRFRVAGMLETRPSDTVVAAVAELKSLSNVEMVGYLRREQVPRFLSRALGLLCTSDYEGFSNTFLEAASVGTPLILRHQVDPDNVVTRHGLGLLAADERELEIRLAEMWNMNADMFVNLSNQCTKYIASHHDPSSRARELVMAVEPFIHAKRL